MTGREGLHPHFDQDSNLCLASQNHLTFSQIWFTLLFLDSICRSSSTFLQLDPRIHSGSIQQVRVSVLKRVENPQGEDSFPSFQVTNQPLIRPL